jgi:hypothetical protein
MLISWSFENGAALCAVAPLVSKPIKFELPGRPGRISMVEDLATQEDT